MFREIFNEYKMISTSMNLDTQTLNDVRPSDMTFVQAAHQCISHNLMSFVHKCNQIFHRSKYNLEYFQILHFLNQ